jgi:hypothetical protein
MAARRSLRCHVHASHGIDDAELRDSPLLIDLPKAKRHSIPSVIDMEDALHAGSFWNHALPGIGAILLATSGGGLAAFVGCRAYVELIFAIIDQESAIDLSAASRSTPDINEFVNGTFRLCRLGQPNRGCNAMTLRMTKHPLPRTFLSYISEQTARHAKTRPSLLFSASRRALQQRGAGSGHRRVGDPRALCLEHARTGTPRS